MLVRLQQSLRRWRRSRKRSESLPGYAPVASTEEGKTLLESFRAILSDPTRENTISPEFLLPLLPATLPHSDDLLCTLLEEGLRNFDPILDRLISLADLLKSDERKALVLEHTLLRSKNRSARKSAASRISSLEAERSRVSLHQLLYAIVSTGIHDRERSVRTAALELFPYLTGAHLIRVLKQVFRSSYRHHAVRTGAVRSLSLLSEETRLKMIERIVSMGETDEKLILDSAGDIRQWNQETRTRLLLMLLKNAPYDNIVINAVQALQELPGERLSPEVYSSAARALLPLLGVKEREIRLAATRLISLFPPLQRRKLVDRSLEVSCEEGKRIALQQIVGLPGEDRAEILYRLYRKSLPDSQRENVWNLGIRLIALAPPGQKEELYDLALSRITEQLRMLAADPFYYSALYLIPGLVSLPLERQNKELWETAEAAIRRVLQERGSPRQIQAVEAIHSLPEERRGALVREALDADRDDTILRINSLLKHLPEQEREVLLPLYYDRLIRHGLSGELKHHSLASLLESLSSLSPLTPVELYPELKEMRLYSMQELVRYLMQSFRQAGLFSDRLLDEIRNRIRSDNEKASLLHDLLFFHRGFLRSLSPAGVRILYRIALLRHKRKERGLAGELVTLVEETRAGRIDPEREERVLTGYLRREETRQFDPLIYYTYRELKPEQRDTFMSTIRKLTHSILEGSGYGRLREELERTGPGGEKGEEFVFSLLLQLLPVDSSHMDRQTARQIFRDGVLNEKAILEDLHRISPALTEPGSKIGISLLRPSYEIIRTQKHPFRSPALERFFQLARPGGVQERFCDLAEMLTAQDPDSFVERIHLYLVCRLRSQVLEMWQKFSSASTRYEALNGMYDLLGDTFQDTITEGIQRLRQYIPRSLLEESLFKLIHRLELEIPRTRYAGFLKPGDVIRILRTRIRQSGIKMEDLLEELPMALEESPPGECNWRKVIHLLRNTSDPRHQDPALAGELEEAVQKRDSRKNRELTELYRGKRQVDPLRRLFELTDRPVRGEIIREIEEGLSAFHEEERIPGPPVRYRIGKSAWLSIYGGLADICIAKDTRLFARDNFTLLSMIQEDRYVGFNLLHFVKEENETILVLAGCEPGNAYASRHTPAQIYDEVVEVLTELAGRAGIRRVVQIADENAYSNREKIKQHIKRTVARGEPDGRLKRTLYLGSFGMSSFRSNSYYTLRTLPENSSRNN